ncbi:sulfate transport system substrate-binding protein [Chromobacterium alkanivorans]|uniref:sulfate ABC transporter substrate-binding protein n=1 Tax=Chromobacterium TaxID=535 RepID=UPI000653AEF7|nr:MULTISPECIES: sulfate ABC transporter substrate-binding protein [Chromobacterium]KMN82399.1 thiosulfate transporter subunit [Chromobacterium sp. LK11]MCS3805453.1 sulfate transport system substrate-binding protein [Chromobacterium alkanivorans]MCS3819792.1 sulfate transport system substrate-binding protein [Chromobacterium alkanivorans]MCS3874233.1 sulfate transport system substrate-binding protein [Chromobacterium alkanivorans]
MKLRLALAALLLAASGSALADATLLNVSYDVMRDFYKDYNPAFQKAYKAKTGETVTLQQSHGGSSKQALAVANGLAADVITMNQATDIDLLAGKGLLPANWASRLPNHAVPFTSTIVFLVRKGNPQQVRDWSDLAKPGLKVVIPNPKTSGNGRYSYLAAWGYALKQPGGNEAKAQDLVGRIFKNVPVLDGGGRAATTTFMQRQIGDVLVTFENEAEMIAREFGRGGFELVYPSLSVLAENPVSVVDKVVDRKGSRKQAEAYLQYLWSPEGQKLAADNYLRPQDPAVAKQFAARFPAVKTFTVASVFGSWAAVNQKHFADGGSFDQIFSKK